MNGIRTILIPVDGSENSQRALSYGAYLAELSNASVSVLHVVNLSAAVSNLGQVSTGSYIPDSVLKDIQEAGHFIINKALEQIPATVKAAGFLKIGSPTGVIVSFCKENKDDLIVMGSRGLGAIRQLVMGSISSYVLYHAPCPVLVVK